MEEFFVSRSSAVARIVAARRALLKEEDEGAGLNAGERQSRLELLERLLFDVRAGRRTDFVMPTPSGQIRLLVTAD